MGMLAAFGLALAATACLGAYQRLWNQPGRIDPDDANDQRAYFYDLATDAIFISDRRIVPPIIPVFREGTPAAGRAHVFGCGGCGQDRLFIGYVETYTAEAHVAAVGRRPDLPRAELDATIESGHLVSDARGQVARRGADGVAWFENRMEKVCNGFPATPCSPRNTAESLAVAREWPGSDRVAVARP